MAQPGTRQRRGIAVIPFASLPVALVLVVLLAGCRGAGSERKSQEGSSREGASTNPFRSGRTLVIPHAGGDGLFPENTIIAYEKSIALGGDVVDIDVQLSKDMVPMAIHDATLNRTTNGTGRVDAHTAAELAFLDAGWTFTVDGTFPFRGQKVGVPTLEEVLRRFPGTLTTLDLKDQRVAVVGPVCKILTSLGRANTVYVGIDTDEQVEAFRKKCPEIKTSGTSTERRLMRAAREANDPNFRTQQLVSQPEYLGDNGEKRVTKVSLSFSHSYDIAVLTYVVDDPAAMAELIDLGVDGIYTRRPDLMVKVREQREQFRKGD
jgi:glycerophosphoryl diester phosphodiesterase